MGQDLRIEDADHTSFITTRTLGSRLWFHKQKHLQERIRAYLGKYQEKYSVIIYAFTILGNHYHLQAKFPHCNRAEFMRDFNSMITRLTKRYVSSCPEGSFWARRYKTQAIVREEDSEEYFLYVALNPISSGLVKKLGDYNNFGYSSCFHSLREAQQSYKIIDWRTFQDKRRFNKKLSPKDFESTYTLTFSRLPGYEHLSAKEYEKSFRQKVEDRRKEIIAERQKQKKGFAGVMVLKNIQPGQRPRQTKKSSRYDARPLILTSCVETKRVYIDFYFSIRAAFTEVYEALREGVVNVTFPPGTYHPPLGWIAR